MDLGGAINVTADSTFTNNLTVDKNLTVNGIIYGQPSSNQFAINSTTRVRAHYNDSYSMWIGRGTEDGQWTTNRGLYDTYTSAWIIYKNDSSNIHFSKDANVYCHGHCRPNSNATYDLGGSSYRWDTLYVKSTNVSGSDRKEKDILGSFIQINKEQIEKEREQEKEQIEKEKEKVEKEKIEKEQELDDEWETISEKDVNFDEDEEIDIEPCFSDYEIVENYVDIESAKN